MWKLEYCHPITHKTVNRSFKKLFNLYEELKKFHSPISYGYFNSDQVDYDYIYGYYDPVTDQFIEDCH